MKKSVNHRPCDNDDHAVIAKAINCVNEKSNGMPLASDVAITLNFHPDTIKSGESLVSQLAKEGVYRSQFETMTSNGSLSAYKGGRRWEWESSMFCGAYDCASPALRPKYGALNYKKHSAGAAPRFGSAHLRLKACVLTRSTFAYPDSHLDPVDFGTQERMDLISLADRNEAGLERLDDFIEAHVHGVVLMNTDVDAIVLDPSFRNTMIESAARRLPFDVEWHDGFSLGTSSHTDYLSYRDKETADFLEQLLDNGPVDAATLSPYRNGSVDLQTVKKAWHCIVKFGGTHSAD